MDNGMKLLPKWYAGNAHYLRDKHTFAMTTVTPDVCNSPLWYS